MIAPQTYAAPAALLIVTGALLLAGVTFADEQKAAPASDAPLIGISQAWNAFPNEVLGLKYNSEGIGFKYLKYAKNRWYGQGIAVRANSSGFLQQMYKFDVENGRKTGTQQVYKIVALNPDIGIQIWDQKIDLLTISKESAETTRNRRFSSNWNYGPFQAYLFVAFAYAHRELGMEGVRVSGFGPEPMFFFDSQPRSDVLEMLKDVEWSYSTADFGLVVSTSLPAGDAAKMRVHFLSERGWFPYKWEYFKGENRHPEIVYEADLETIRLDAPLPYCERFQLKSFDDLDAEEPKQVSRVDYQITEYTLDAQINADDFIVDPTRPKLIRDFDSDTWIRPPR